MYNYKLFKVADLDTNISNPYIKMVTTLGNTDNINIFIKYLFIFMMV